MRTQYFCVADGRAVDEAEAMFNGTLRAGYGTRNHAMMKDGFSIADADERRAEQHGVSLSQASYENRVSDAWKGEQPAPASRIGDDAGGQTAYERRIANAWKETR